MSSIDNSNDLPRSMQNLWTLLSGSLNLKSLQFIADELEQNQHQLMEGILFFKPHDVNKNSVEELSKRKLPGISPHILHNMSVFLDLEATQCHQLFQSYLLYQYKGTPETAKSLFSSEKQMKELFENLWFYYYSERIFTLFCFKQILSNWKTNDHIYSKIFQNFLKHINSDNQLLNKLIEQLKFLIQFNLESRVKFGPYFNDRFQSELRENILKEQSEILLLLLLYYKNFEPSIENVNELLKLFIEYGFGSKINSPTNMGDFIGLLKSLLIVECLDPNYLYKCHIDGIEHFILKPENSTLISGINSMVLNMNTSIKEHSPIFICWMIVSVLENNDENGENVERLGSTALELKVFKYLDQCLQSPQMSSLKGSFAYNLVYEIIGNLLAVTFTTFDFEKLIQTEPHLSHLLIRLFSNDVIAKMVFDSSLASGLGLSVRYALDLFPFKTHFLLNLLHSLSQSSSCKSIYETMSILNTLTTYTEELDTSFAHFTPIDSDTFQLIEDKPILPDSKIVLCKGVKGNLFHLSNSRLIKWNDVSLNGWKLLYYRLKYLINQIKQGQMYPAMLNDEVVLNEISTVAFICAELIAHNAHQNISHFKAIVGLLLDTFKLMVNFNQASIRLFMAGIIQLGVNIMKYGYMAADQIWFLLTEKKFFPYMIGFSNQLNEIVAGTDTNISTLGYILSTDEFIKGNYELTFSFLELILHFIKKEQFLKESSIIASFIFIIKDIFPSYKLWNYKNDQDANRIGHLCIDIFYNLLNRARKKKPEELLQIERIGTILLMEGNSAEYLLQIIKNGEETVKRKILYSGNDSLLLKDHQIVAVRTSLLILSYLLESYSQVNVGGSQRTKSVIEDMLFSSTQNNSNPNMLLIFTYFVYQKYDIYLATNAMQLLSQLAFKFPMSMLACFGAHTESIRDHFLFRLETLTEDINFKISLLNFLSICVEHQPGLVEMFLNVSNNQGGVLSSILEILEEKLEGQYFCPFELHQASLQFVAKFWLRPNIIAINLLKKNDTFWKLITFPLFTKEEFNYSLCSYILKILSREMFYTKMLEKEALTKELEDVFARIKSENIIERLSAQIRTKIIEPLEIDADALALIDSWKDFISSWTMFKQMTSDSLNATVINGVLENLSILLANNGDSKYTKIINKLSNLLLLISSNWKPSTIELLKRGDFIENVIELFGNVIQNKDVISFNALVSLNTCLLKIILCLPQMSNARLFSHVCHLLNSSIQLINKQLSLSKGANVNLTLEKKLVNVHLFIVISTLRNVRHSNYSKYLDTLRKYEITELVFNLLIFLVHNNVHLDLAQNLPLYFVTVSSTADGADMLFNQNIVNNFAIYFRLPSLLFDSRQENLELNYICHIFSLLVRTVINMTIHLKHHFIESCISFVAIYSDSFRELCKGFRQSRKLKNADLILLAFELCSTLAKYIKVWQSSHSISLKLMTEEILLTSNSVIAFILRPTLLAQSFEELLPDQMSSVSSSSSATFHQAQALVGNSKGGLSSSSNKLLLQILLHSFKFVLDISPGLFDLFEEENMSNGKYDLLLSTNFSLPNADSLEVLTFGSLVNFINYIIRSIYKLEKDSALQAKEPINENINLDISLLESGLTILLNQTLTVKNICKIDQIDKQIFFREIHNEMNNITSNLSSKPQRRQNSISTLATPSPIKQTPAVNLMERQYIQLILKLMDNIIQIQ